MDKLNNFRGHLLAVMQAVGPAFRWSVLSLDRGAEWLMTRRALAIAALVSALFLANVPWLQLPMSRDPGLCHLPLGSWEESSADSSQSLFEQREFRLVSAALPLWIVLGGGLVVVSFRPRFLSPVAGLLTIIGIATLSACLFNHPLLTDRMDSELRQRIQVGRAFGLYQENAWAAKLSPRVQDTSAMNASLEPGKPLRGRIYILYGPAFIVFTLLVMLVSATDRWWRRLLRGFVCLMIGFLLAGVVTSRRWRAEYQLHKAQSAEFGNRFDEARRAVDTLLEIAPEFGVRPVTWALRGRLDARQGRTTDYSEYFRARQFADQDDLRRALFLCRPIHARHADCFAVSELFCQIHATMAVRRADNGNFGVSMSHWREVYQTAPWRIDGRIGCALALQASGEQDPSCVEDLVATLFGELGDPLLENDLTALVADAYFENGDFETAREYYRLAVQQIRQPNRVNAHAQERMIGM